MATHESTPQDAIDVLVFCDTSADTTRNELTAGFDDLPAFSVSAVRPLSALADTDTDKPVVVFSDATPETAAHERATVWVTTDATVARTVSEHAAVVNWEPGDDWEMLSVRLHEELRQGTSSVTRAEDAGVALDRVGERVLALDTAHRVTYLGESATDLFDGSQRDLLGATAWEHAPADVETVLRPAVEQALSSLEPVTTTVDPDDRSSFEMTIHPDDSGVTLYSSDPEMESTPSLYEYLVETVGDAVYILDDEGRFVFVNDALCEMTGYDRDALLGSSVHIIKDDETVIEAEDALRDLLKSRGGADGIDIAKLDVELVRADDERVPCTDRMTLRPLDDGEFTGTVGTLRDISRQYRRRELLSGIIERSRAMMTATETRAVADIVVSTAVEVFDLDLATLRKYDPDEDVLKPLTKSAAAGDVLGERPTYGTAEGPVGRAFTSGELVVRDDLSAETATDVTAVDHGAYLPIGDQYVLSVGHGTDERFDDITLGLLEVFGETAGAAFDRVHREENLRQYEAIVEASEDMLFTVDSEWRFTLVTRPFAQMLGDDRETLVGRRLDEFLPAEDAGDVLASDGHVVIETEFDGDESVPCRLVLSPFEDGSVGTVTDISQLKSAQREASRQRRRFVELFEILSDPVVDVTYEDGTATLDSVNPAFATLCDCDTTELQNETLASVQTAMPPTLADTLDSISSPAPSLDTTVTVQTPRGDRHYLIRAAPYESEDTDRAFVLLTDVTEVKRRGTQLKVLHRLLRHNLRNQTALIQGYAEQLRQLDLPAGADDYIQHILDASDELVGASETSKTVQQLLNFDESSVEGLPAEVAIERLQNDIDGSVSTQETTVTVTAETAELMPFSDYLLVALRELVENAVEHDPASRVDVRATPVDGGGVEISVADDGEGLPESQWELLTGDREITQLQHADGLGLWLVKWVTDKHGGRLRLDSVGDDGTTVSLVFPEYDRD